MRFSLASAAVVALAAQVVVGDSWLGNAGRTAYNKWHETELERWLSDHNIPYPTPADRKNLQDLVQKNWEDNIAKPYNSWDVNQLQSYLSSKGADVKKGAAKDKDSLLQQVQSYWHETAEQANDAYSSAENWVFNTWTDSQLKSFLDYHQIPNPTPRTRDSLLQTVRSNYGAAAKKAGETAGYPGNWLYSQWSDSDLKTWLDERGVPVPQPSDRDKLIASIRRNSRIASDRASAEYSSLSSSAAGAQQSLSDQLLNSWSDSQIKEWFDKAGIKVPQGSKRNELVALARKHSAQLSGNNVQGSAASAYGAATSSAGNYYAQATDGVYGQARHYYDAFLNQFGMASKDAQASLSYNSATAAASASASSAASAASASLSSAQGNAESAYQKATGRVKEEL